MTYTELQDLGSIGLRELLNFPNLDTPNFYPIFLFVVFIVFVSMSFYREMRREGKANLLGSLAVGGFVTIAFATGLSLLGLIQVEIMVITLVICMVFVVLFLLTGRGN